MRSKLSPVEKRKCCSKRCGRCNMVGWSDPHRALEPAPQTHPQGGKRWKRH